MGVVSLCAPLFSARNRRQTRPPLGHRLAWKHTHPLRQYFLLDLNRIFPRVKNMVFNGTFYRDCAPTSFASF